MPSMIFANINNLTTRQRQVLFLTQTTIMK